MEDPQIEARLDLPQGDFDIPLGITAKQYKKNGQLISVEDKTNDVVGDVVHVNGQPWPFLNVEPREYRFRLLDMSLSRSFKLSIHNSSNDKVDFHVMASDSGFTSEPVMANELTISMAERYEIVVDFDAYAGQTLTMMNDREVFVADDYAGTNRVMQFRVGSKVSSDSNNGPLPKTLVPLPSMAPKTKVDRTFKFDQE